MSVGKRDYLTRFQTLLTLLILNGMVKTKLAILPILCCEEIYLGKTPMFYLSTGCCTLTHQRKSWRRRTTSTRTSRVRSTRFTGSRDTICTGQWRSRMAPNITMVGLRVFLRPRSYGAMCDCDL